MSTPPQSDIGASDIQPVRRFKVSDSIAAQIEEMVKNRSYAVGDKLPSERVLAQEFGVGRSSMREAFRLLEARGFVRIVHGVGVFIAGQRSAEARNWMLLGAECTVPELFEVRLTLECGAAALAAKEIRRDEIGILQELIASWDLGRLSDEEFIKKDQELHMAIVRATRNRLYIRLYESILDLFLLYSERAIRLPGRREAAHAGHVAIVDAVVNKRVQDARRAMKEHLRTVEQDINEYLAIGERDPTVEV